MSRLADLQRRMDAAAAALDFEAASSLRDQISLLMGADSDAPDVDPSGLTRQQPGKMGIGTSQQRTTPPPGWKPPAKPDPMTAGVSRPRRKPR